MPIGKMPLQDLETRLVDSLVMYGLNEKCAHRVAKDACVNARRILQPTSVKSRITIVDEWFTAHKITLILNRDISTSPEVILHNYVVDRKKYPVDGWIVEAGTGKIGKDVWICSKPKVRVVGAKEKKVKSGFSKLKGQAAADMAARLQRIVDNNNM